jgi:hypothetical protein
MCLPLPNAKDFGLLATDSDLDPQRLITFAVIWSVVKHLAAIFAARFFRDVLAGQLFFGVVQFTADRPTRCADEVTLGLYARNRRKSRSVGRVVQKPDSDVF